MPCAATYIWNNTTRRSVENPKRSATFRPPAQVTLAAYAAAVPVTLPLPLFSASVLGWRLFLQATNTRRQKMKALTILVLCCASVVLADDFKTVDGKEYKNATVSRVEPDGIVITFSGGIVKPPFDELPPDVQTKYGYDSKAAATYAAEENQRQV